ncbi:MAG: oligosaccharide flippase family protein [Chloroflexi bacterium]|nr:oligosaccharide flippase family protein [Chloroflexota bacterium]
MTNISSVLQAMLTFRYLGVENYGRLILLLSFFATARMFFDLGSRGIFISEIAKAQGAANPQRVKGLITVYIRFVTISTSIPTIIFLGIAWLNQDIVYVLLAVYVLLFGLNNGLNIILLSFTKFRRSAGQQIVRSFTRLTLLLFIPLLPNPSLFLLVLFTYPAKEITTLILSLKWSRPIYNQLRDVRSESIDFWHLFQQQGIYTIIGYPVRQIIGELPVWLLRVLVDETAVGLYGAARKAIEIASSLFQQIETILTPVLPEQMAQNSDRARIVIRQSQKYTFWLSLSVITICFPLAPLLISIISGAEFGDVSQPFRWLLITLLITPFIQSHRPILFALKQQKALLYIRVLKFMTYAPMLIYFILKNETVGATQAILIDGILHLFIRWTIIRKVTPQFWVSPLTIFTIEPFDIQLWQKFTTQVKKRANR